ncbi:MAG: DUF2892 domain-containing protein [Haloarculaceae archaeon]
MNENVGATDRRVRIAVGLVLLVAGIGSYAANWAGPALAAVAVLLGAVLTATGLLRQCAIYAVLGVDTTGDQPAAGEDTPPAERSA